MDEEFVREFFASEGLVTIRRMFGGYGVYLNGMIVALSLRGEILLKSDAETAPLFEAAGSRRWVYERPGKSPVAMPYFELPGEALDDPDAMARWARRAFEAARRVAEAKSSPPKKIRDRSRSA